MKVKLEKVFKKFAVLESDKKQQYVGDFNSDDQNFGILPLKDTKPCGLVAENSKLLVDTVSGAASSAKTGTVYMTVDRKGGATDALV